MTLPHDKQVLLKLSQTKMPFGKYSGRLLLELPEPYLVWFSNKGFPKGELGELMAMMLEVKTNGLEYLLRPLAPRTPPDKKSGKSHLIFDD